MDLIKRFRELEGGNKLIYVPIDYFDYIMGKLDAVEEKYPVQITPFDLMKDNKLYIEGSKEETQNAANLIRSIIYQKMRLDEMSAVTNFNFCCLK